MSMRKVRELMTSDVLYLPADVTLDEAARAMRERNVGDVVVTEGPTMVGIMTDRDIVIRAVADRKDPTRTTLGDIASRDLVLIEQDASVGEAAEVMRSRSVRRLLVCDPDRQLVGILSVADLSHADRATDDHRDVIDVVT